MSEQKEHPLRMAKDLGLILLTGKETSKSYITLSYEGLLELAERSYWAKRDTILRAVS